LQEEQNPNAVTQSGTPKLLEAVRNGNRAGAEALLRRGANPDRKGEATTFPLHEAASLASGSGEMVELLLEHNATVGQGGRRVQDAAPRRVRAGQRQRGERAAVEERERE